jgi:hypothetical protein
MAEIPTAYYKSFPEKDWPAFENVLLDATRLAIEELRDRMTVAGTLTRAIAAAPSWQGVPQPSLSETMTWLQERSHRSVRSAFEGAQKAQPGLRTVADAVLARIKELSAAIPARGGRKRKFDRSQILAALGDIESIVREMREVNGLVSARAKSRDAIDNASLLAAMIGIADPSDPRIRRLASYLKHRGMSDRAVAQHAVGWQCGASLRSIQKFDSGHPPSRSTK